jgi:hypothetical protein
VTGNPSPDMHVSGITQAEASSLFELRRHWEDTYRITLADGVWQAKPFDNVTHVLTADSAHELRTKLQEDSAARRYGTNGSALVPDPGEETYKRLQEILKDAESKGLRVSVTSASSGHHRLEVRLA